MSVASVLAQGRAAALQLMVDTCTITRAGTATFSDVTGNYSETPTTVYSGPCRIKSGRNAGSGRDVQFGEHEATLHAYEIVLPWDTSGQVRRQDTVTITSSDDTWVLNRPMEVVDVAYTGTSTARRITAEDRS